MIRFYCIRDTDAIVEVWYAAARIAHDFVPETFWQTERNDLTEKYLPLAETWVYERDNRVVGFLSLMEREVGGLFVLPAYQGQAIGTQLLQHARMLRGALSLNVFQQNLKALCFYEKCGFHVTGEILHEPTGCMLFTMQS